MHRQVKRIDTIEKQATVHEVEMRFLKDNAKKQTEINENLGKTMDGVKMDTAVIKQILQNSNNAKS